MAYPQSRNEFNAPLLFALQQHAIWSTGTPVVYRTFHPDLWTISYFNQQAVWLGMQRVDLPQLDRYLASAHGGPLWLEANAYDAVASNNNGRLWLETHDRPTELVDFKDAKHEFRFHCLR